MRLLSFCCLSLFYFLISLSVVQADNAKLETDRLIESMQKGGYILMLRHAKAPGFGDPDNIQIGDCSTQRNLDDVGRQQARNIGKWLHGHAINTSDVYSSQWCRCMETAKLLEMGTVTELPALNSFFQMQHKRESNLKELKQFIAQLNPNEKLIIMVTHHVTIAEISGQNVSSGDGVLLKLSENKTKNSPAYEFVGLVSNMQRE